VIFGLNNLLFLALSTGTLRSEAAPRCDSPFPSDSANQYASLPCWQL
jgi:hypothetical protein